MTTQTTLVATALKRPFGRAGPRVSALWLCRWLLIWLLALVVRAGCWSRDPRVVWGDEPFYLWLGRNWITGQGFQFMGHPDVHHGPLFPMLAGLLYLLDGRPGSCASEILYVLFGSLLVLPMYAIGASFTTDAWGWRRRR